MDAQQRERRADHPGPGLYQPRRSLSAQGAGGRPHGGGHRGQADGDAADEAGQRQSPQARPGYRDPHERGEAEVVRDRAPARPGGQPVADDRYEQPRLARQRRQCQHRCPRPRHPARVDGAPGGPALADPLLAPLRHSADERPDDQGEEVRVEGQPGQDVAGPAPLVRDQPGGHQGVGQIDRPGRDEQGDADGAPGEGPMRPEQLGAQESEPHGSGPARAAACAESRGDGRRGRRGSGDRGDRGIRGAHAAAPRPVTRAR